MNLAILSTIKLNPYQCVNSSTKMKINTEKYVVAILLAVSHCLDCFYRAKHHFLDIFHVEQVNIV